jgi:hypothetical protein
LAFLTTHFALAASVSEDRAHQEESVRRILAFCRTLPPGMPLVLTGDMDATPELRPIDALLEEQDGPTEHYGFQNASMRATGGDSSMG